MSDCPRNVRSSGVHEHIIVNSAISCISDAHPPARYQWNVIKGAGTARGPDFVVSSEGFFNISCTAYNLLRPPDDQCFGATIYTTGYVSLPDGMPARTNNEKSVRLSVCLTSVL